MSDHQIKFAKRLVESSRACLTTKQYARRLDQIDLIDRLLEARGS
ncbi:MAG TPA: hypothetical protein VLF41_02280 [Candidatus Nanoarchaeia archaeon]|nr:hypothetical protein [Candidatus Nanoarchaeia archaeon]